jgi:hypothetical protein
MGSKPFETPKESLPKRIELCLLLPPDWKLEENWKESKYSWPIILLRKLARYPFINKTWFGYGHTITQYFPLCIMTKFNSTILLKSKILPNEFQKIKHEKNIIEVYLLFPLYSKELQYAEKNGSEKLAQLIERENISEIIDCNRKNVCKKI